MDEPTASLDYHNAMQVLELVGELAQDGYGVLLSTHSPEHPFAYADRVLLMKQGRVLGFDTPEQTLTSENLLSAYGVDMDIVTMRDRHGAQRRICLPVRRAPAGEGEVW